MQFRGMEDRLNPIAPPGADESTLGGYAAVHGRSPAFEGSDGLPYTVAIEAEAAEDESDVWVGYLVFLRWAADSTAIMGHIESGDLTHGGSAQEVRLVLEQMALVEVKALLDRLIAEREAWAAE